eukprot:TRINITY_DN7260_c0_g2_i4.p1 TRINITY_DN7260_c0_g2~~TRINITY_DN7260_c0_g2_i4.p1  ORF type:complete len:211 (+),score=46.72 TRINITY_DN7260_c0_g2_i4:161-793(+)
MADLYGAAAALAIGGLSLVASNVKKKGQKAGESIPPLAVLALIPAPLAAIGFVGAAGYIGFKFFQSPSTKEKKLIENSNPLAESSVSTDTAAAPVEPSEVPTVEEQEEQQIVQVPEQPSEVTAQDLPLQVTAPAMAMLEKQGASLYFSSPFSTAPSSPAAQFQDAPQDWEHVAHSEATENGDPVTNASSEVVAEKAEEAEKAAETDKLSS